MMPSPSRRDFMKHTALLSMMATLPSFSALAANAKASGPFTLPELGYAYDALIPTIDAKTMEIHHTKHHQAYIDKLNGEVAKTPALSGKSLEEIVASVSKYKPVVRNNAGGHWNHSFFWKLMAPEGQRGEMSPELKTAIDTAFGSKDKMIEAFDKAGTERFGSGWVWLIKNKQGKLEIVSTQNQDNPLMDDAAVKGTPILGNDVWEHAYYLTYQNKRADYLKAWWNVVNWKQVSDNFAAA